MPAVDPAELAAQLNEAVGGDRLVIERCYWSMSSFAKCL